jgi:ubiquinone/menaquinone biosynthesis C-methylase UbiE
MADRLVSFAEPLVGKRALDVGTGSGAAARALVARGALVAATDLAHGMLADRRSERPPAAVGDITRIPFRTSAFDVAVAAFVVNHLDDPTAALRELARVCRPGGVVLVSSFATGPEAAVKAAIEDVAIGFGWSRPDWYSELKTSCATTVETTEQLVSGLQRAGLERVESWVEEVSFADLPPESIAAWRLWSPALGEFVEALPAAARDELIAAATDAARRSPPVSLRMLVGRAVAG